MSYRLPHRLGIFSLEVKNLFDADMRFEGTDPLQLLGEEDPSAIRVRSLLAPERLFLVKFTLAF